MAPAAMLRAPMVPKAMLPPVTARSASLAVVTAPSASLVVVTAPSASLGVVTAPGARVGLGYVPARSPPAGPLAAWAGDEAASAQAMVSSAPATRRRRGSERGMGRRLLGR